MSVTVLLLRVTAQQQLAYYELVSGYVFNDNNS